MATYSESYMRPVCIERGKEKLEEQVGEADLGIHQGYHDANK